MPVGPEDSEALVARLGTADDPLTDDAITRDYRVWQRKKGHRYSLDDVLTAAQAVHAKPDARRHADLGCGLGSVLLMVAWKLPEATHAALEAQAVSHELARRNIERNGLSARVALHRGDLRDAATLDRLAGPFDLVTGTPPYVIPGRATPAPDPQKAYARVEYRGGVEDYLAAMARLLAPGGRAVVCCDARFPERAIEGGARVGLEWLERLDAIPSEGTPPLFSVFTFARAGEITPSPRATSQFVARTASRKRSAHYVALRDVFGLEARYVEE